MQLYFFGYPVVDRQGFGLQKTNNCLKISIAIQSNAGNGERSSSLTKNGNCLEKGKPAQE
jgi:hypothetical protein